MSRNASPSTVAVVVAFAIVYIVWGSTYFFIQNALKGFTPFLMGTFRFLTAGLILLSWCAFKKFPIFDKHTIGVATVSGLLLLFLDNGIFIWAEQYLPSSLAAIMASGVSLWFIVLDKRKWKANFSNTFILLGLLLGVVGILLLFGEQLKGFFSGKIGRQQLIALIALALAPATWAIGSLYSKYRSRGNENVWVAIGWQMPTAGIAFALAGWMHGDFKALDWNKVPTDAIASVVYLIFFGSLAAYSSYIWLLKVRSAMQVSTHAYVNPVIAVLLGGFFGNEQISMLQVAGLGVILVSVLFINMSDYWKNRKQIRLTKQAAL